MTEKALTADSGRYRVNSIDVLRGIIMLIMALDHTRDYFHGSSLNPTDPAQPALFLTRWITHFCAPTFLFLSGVSAYIASLKRSKNEASLFLISRGLWLIFIEIFVVTFGILFNPYYNLIAFQVIWAIGASMILLGIVSRISKQLVLVVGIIILMCHNLLDAGNSVYHLQVGPSVFVDLLVRPNFNIAIDSNHAIVLLYPVLPWAALMFIGFGIGHWFNKEYSPAKRRSNLLLLGSSMLVLFVLLRATGVYGNPFPWVKGDGAGYNLLSFINVNKYPPSLLYSCMTVGTSCIVLAVFDRVKAGWTRFFSVYGQVPFFYYILHFYLLHILLVIFFFAEGYPSSAIRQTDFPQVWFRPGDFGYALPIVYLIWLSVILALYFPCRWFAKYKKTHKKWWLSYV
jgi:uncharacterized membrane protein